MAELCRSPCQAIESLSHPFRLQMRRHDACSSNWVGRPWARAVTSCSEQSW